MAAGWEGVFYQHSPPDSALYFQPLRGGPPQKTIDCVTSARFSIGKQGIYYMPCQARRTIEHDAPVHLLNPATGEDRQVAILKDIQFPVWSQSNQSFSVSADGKTILYCRLASAGGDLMLIGTSGDGSLAVMADLCQQLTPGRADVRSNFVEVRLDLAHQLGPIARR